jgi:invasion protein IalB
MISKESPNFVVGGGVFAVAMLSLLLSTGGAAAQASNSQKRPAVPARQAAPAATAAPQDTTKATPGWSVHCGDAGQGLVCKAVQSVALAKTRRLLASVTVTKPAADKNGTILLRLPLGIFNPAGVIVSIDDGKPEALKIQTCDAKGCYAGGPIAPEKLAAMRKGATLKLVFQNLRKKAITVPVPLKGFEAAYAKL